MKGIVEFVIELSVIIALGTVGFNHIYHETKMTALKKVGKGTVSLTRLTSSMTGQPNWLDTPAKKYSLNRGP